jgi:hypothetical protein
MNYRYPVPKIDGTCIEYRYLHLPANRAEPALETLSVQISIPDFLKFPQAKNWSSVKSSTPNPTLSTVSRIQSLESRLASLDMDETDSCKG